MGLIIPGRYAVYNNPEERKRIGGPFLAILCVRQQIHTAMAHGFTLFSLNKHSVKVRAAQRFVREIGPRVKRCKGVACNEILL